MHLLRAPEGLRPRPCLCGSQRIVAPRLPGFPPVLDSLRQRRESSRIAAALEMDSLQNFRTEGLSSRQVFEAPLTGDPTGASTGGVETPGTAHALTHSMEPKGDDPESLQIHSSLPRISSAKLLPDAGSPPHC